MTRSSRNRLGKATGVGADEVFWFKYSVAEVTTPGVAAVGWQAGLAAVSTVPVIFVHRPCVRVVNPTPGNDWLAPPRPQLSATCSPTGRLASSFCIAHAVMVYLPGPVGSGYDGPM